MRNLSRTMIGLLVGAAMLTPIAAQAQEHGRDRGGQQQGGWQRGNDGGGRQQGNWQRGNDGGGQRGGGERADRGIDRSAAMSARRDAIQQGREASRAVERPTRQDSRPDFAAARERQQSRRDTMASDRSRALEQRRQAEEVQSSRAYQDRDGRRDWNRDRDTNRDRTRSDDRNRNWNREGNWDGRNDGNRRWTTDRRDWNGRGNDNRWNRDWRNDRRYSWQNYRSHNRHVYRLPRYEARYGYSYRRWYPGYRFDPFFYGASYWISDPWFYRLPPAYGDYRWVRYYDDVALVDIRTGEIVDIIYSFFL